MTSRVALVSGGLNTTTGGSAKWAGLAILVTVPVVLGLLLNPLVAGAVIATVGVVSLAIVRPRTFFAAGLIVLLMQRTFGLYVPGGGIDGLDEAFVAACAVIFPVRRLAQGHALRAIPGLVPLAAFLILGIAGDVLNAVPFGVAGQGLLLISKGFILAWATAQLDWDDAALARTVKISAGIVVCLIIGAAINFVAPGPWTSIVLNGAGAGTRFGISPVTSFFQHPGYFGTVMAMSCLAAAAFGTVFRFTRTTLFILLGTIVAAFLTARRKILVGLAAGLIVLGMRTRPVPTLILLLVGGPLVLAVAWEPLTAVMTYTYEEYFANPDAVARIRLTVDSLGIALASFPFGAGFGRFGSAAARANYSPIYYELGYPGVWGLGTTEESGSFLTDTFWPAIIGEAGLIGLACFAVSIVLITRAFVKLGRASSRWDRWIGVVGILWTTQLLIESIAGAVFTAVPTFAIYFALVGVAAMRSASTSKAASVAMSRP